MLFELDQVFARTEDWFELRCKQQLEEQTIGPSLGFDSVLEVRSARPCPSTHHSTIRELHLLNISSALSSCTIETELKIQINSAFSA